MVDDPAPEDAPILEAPLVEPPMVDDPVAGAPVDGATVDPLPVPAPAPGCMADDPVVADPVPEAVGRSVEPDGVVDVCARAGAAPKAVATRQAAMCFFSIFIS